MDNRSDRLHVELASCVHKQDKRDSMVCGSIHLTSGDNGDLVHYRPELLALALNMLSVNGGLASCGVSYEGRELPDATTRA